MPGPINAAEAKLSTDILMRRCFGVLVDENGDDVLDAHGQVQIVLCVSTSVAGGGGTTLPPGTSADYLRGDLSMQSLQETVFDLLLTGFTNGGDQAVTEADDLFLALRKYQGQFNALKGGGIYEAIISQSGTSNPTILASNGVSGLTITRSSAGVYTINGTGFMNNKTFCTISKGTGSALGEVSISRTNGTTITINSRNSAGTLADGIMTLCCIRMKLLI